MAATAIYISNLPSAINEEDVLSQLRTQIPEAFDAAARVSVSIYNKDSNYSAVVKGINGDYHQLRLKFRDIVLISSATNELSDTINIKLDTGEPRREDGSFIEARPPSFRRRFEQLAGITQRKCNNIFNPEFLNQTNPRIFTGFNPTLFFQGIKPEELVRMYLWKPGRVVFRKPTKQGSIVRYDSQLETIQAIAFLNHNTNAVRNTNKIPIIGNQFEDLATINLQIGLGKEKECIKLEEFANNPGYAPLISISPTLLNSKFIKAAEDSTYCWNCKSPYTIVGLDIYMDYYASKCSCQYDQLMPVKDRAVMWPGELITRLVHEKRVDVDETLSRKLCVQYYPLKLSYKTYEDYLSVIQPLLYEEWKGKSTDFKGSNAVMGEHIKHRVIEVLENSDRSEIEKVKIAMKIKLLTTTKIWIPSNPCAIRKVKLDYNLKYNKTIPSTRRGKLYKIESENASTMIVVKFKIEKSELEKFIGHMRITPKANKTEYNGTKQMFKKLQMEKISHNVPLLKLLLNPCHADQIEWGFDKSPTEKETHAALQVSLNRQLQNDTNKEQMTAIMKGIKNKCSFICGPPGTGKTYTVAKLTNILVNKEDGAVVICTPSNFAADGVAESVIKHAFQECQPPKVLRIWSKTKESHADVTDCGDATSFDIMHVQVKSQMDWLQTKEVTHIASRVKDNKMFLLKDLEIAEFERHLTYQETKVLAKYDVIVTTLGTFLDYRLEAWAKSNKVTTVIFDEAGQICHPMVLSALLVNPERVVITGDPYQLQPPVSSFAAEIAGLNTSLMEMITLTYTPTLPWTTLLEQHRMHSDIRKIVSEVTYQGKLRDAKEIGTRHDVAMQPLLEKFIEKRVLIIDHKGEESKVGNSYNNPTEADAIITAVQNMLNWGIPKHAITILTFYDAQKELILRKLYETKLEIDTRNVDAFQGRESKIVFVSFVRSNRIQDIGFATSTNRLNVAISRSQEYFIAAMNVTFFQRVKMQHWKKLMSLLVEKGAFI